MLLELHVSIARGFSRDKVLQVVAYSALANLRRRTAVKCVGIMNPRYAALWKQEIASLCDQMGGGRLKDFYAWVIRDLPHQHSLAWRDYRNQQL